MNRAILKIEIPFTDHAHCIGRQGNQIQSIMSITDTHIHFPDENRDRNNSNKSNQVSITGRRNSIEYARRLIKDILPISLKFLLPWKHINNDNIRLFENIRQHFGVIIYSRCHNKTGNIYCIIRGLINQKELVEATEYLIQKIYGLLIDVTCQIEISKEYQIYLQMKNLTISSIEQYTNTIIQFPTMINNRLKRKTSVIITGKPMEVCQARKLFDLCLPIILTFEIPIEKEPTHEEIFYMKHQMNISTIIQTRKDKIEKFISLQTQEYNIEQLYHAHSIIFNNVIPMKFYYLPLNDSIDINQVKLLPIGYERSFSLKMKDLNKNSSSISTFWISDRFEQLSLTYFHQMESNEVNSY